MTTTQSAEDVAREIWAALKERCASTPDKSQVTKLVMLNEADIVAASAPVITAERAAAEKRGAEWMRGQSVECCELRCSNHTQIVARPDNTTAEDIRGIHRSLEAKACATAIRALPTQQKEPHP